MTLSSLLLRSFPTARPSSLDSTDDPSFACLLSTFSSASHATCLAKQFLTLGLKHASTVFLNPDFACQCINRTNEIPMFIVLCQANEGHQNTIRQKRPVSGLTILLQKLFPVPWGQLQVSKIIRTAKSSSVYSIVAPSSASLSSTKDGASFFSC